jgi:hypothetical protein
MNYFTLGAYVEIESGLLVQVGVTMNPHHGCTTPFCLTHQHKPLDPEPHVTVRLALLVRSSSPVSGLGEGALCLPFLLQYFRSPRPSTTSLLRPSLVHYDLHLFPQAQYGVELSQTHWRGIPT